MSFRVDTYPEVTWEVFELVPWYRHAFYEGVLLMPETDDGLVEHHAFILFSEHAHQTFHEVLEGVNESA